eukprot:6142059-Prorocentrum_lima.AAC.1
MAVPPPRRFMQSWPRSRSSSCIALLRGLRLLLWPSPLPPSLALSSILALMPLYRCRSIRSTSM